MFAFFLPHPRYLSLVSARKRAGSPALTILFIVLVVRCLPDGSDVDYLYFTVQAFKRGKAHGTCVIDHLPV